MSALTTSQVVSGSFGMSEAKVKRIVRKEGIPYDTNRGHYIFSMKAFESAYQDLFKACSVKVANRSRSATRNQKAAAEAKAQKQAAKK